MTMCCCTVSPKSWSFTVHCVHFELILYEMCLPWYELHSDCSVLRIAVDGPFGSPSSDVFCYGVSVCIAAGIGVTPFASVLKSIWYQFNDDRLQTKLQKVRIQTASYLTPVCPLIPVWCAVIPLWEPVIWNTLKIPVYSEFVSQVVWWFSNTVVV